MKIKAIITGVTGMVGEGVLHECLLRDDVEQILVLSRKPCGILHPKITEILVKDFYNLSDIKSQLSGYNACLFCLGTSSVGISEEEFYKISYTLTMTLATVLSKINPDMTFCYISGSGTNSKSRMAWARTKGKTENDLKKLSFKGVYNFRAGYNHPTKGLKNTLPYYKYLSWLYPILKIILPNSINTLAELGTAMINASIMGYEKQDLEVKDILALSKRMYSTTN